MVKKKRSQRRRSAFSIVELLVVMTIVAALVALAIPAINAMQKSFNSTGAESMISAALSTARTLAISNQQYVGVRFQKAGDPNNALKADQYMIFIINDEDMGTLTDAYRAIEGYKPIKLPENIGVMDMKLGIGSADITSDGQINENRELIDTTAFSIIFSSAGKLVIHDVQTRNKDGKPETDDSSKDDIFNTKKNVIADGIAMFIQDDYSSDGLDKEQSRNKFVIYDRNKFDKLNAGERYTKYLDDLKVNHTVYVNAYTGEIIR